MSKLEGPNEAVLPSSSAVHELQKPSNDPEVCAPTIINSVEGNKGGKRSSRKDRQIRRTQILAFSALIFSQFNEGWHDGTIGPLLPAMQKHYHVGFAVVSLIFVSNAIGFMCAAVANIWMMQRLGFGKCIVIGATCQGLAYCIQVAAPPFPVFAIAPLFSGFGLCFQNAGSLIYAVQYDKNIDRKVAIVQGAYGVGALAAPLLATHFSSLKHWNFFYFTSISGAILNATFLSLVFRFRHLDVLMKEAGQTPREENKAEENLYRQMLKLTTVRLLACFGLLYVGVEVSIGGWIVTYIIRARNGGASSGYIASGYYGGLTLGRVFLLPVTRLVGERRAVWIYLFLCIAFEALVWAIPSLIGDSIAVSFVGFMLTPLYPVIITTAERLVPPWLVSGTVGMIGGISQMGSAVIPFLAGTLASKFGIASLQPLVIGIFLCMMVLWAFVPREEEELKDSVKQAKGDKLDTVVAFK